MLCRSCVQPSLLREEPRPDLRKRQKSSLHSKLLISKVESNIFNGLRNNHTSKYTLTFIKNRMKNKITAFHKMNSMCHWRCFLDFDLLHNPVLRKDIIPKRWRKNTICLSWSIFFKVSFFLAEPKNPLTSLNTQVSSLEASSFPKSSSTFLYIEVKTWPPLAPLANIGRISGLPHAHV